MLSGLNHGCSQNVPISKYTHAELVKIYPFQVKPYLFACQNVLEEKRGKGEKEKEEKFKLGL